MGDGRREMGDGRRETGDGRWEMGDGRWETGDGGLRWHADDAGVYDRRGRVGGKVSRQEAAAGGSGQAIERKVKPAEGRQT